MSEDEFVVLLEHAGIVETADDSAREFVEQAQLLEWLEREGIELFTSPAVLATRAADEGGNGSASGSGNGNGNAIARALPALATGDGLHSNTLLGEARARLARRILERLLAREWISPIEFEYEDDETEVSGLDIVLVPRNARWLRPRRPQWAAGRGLSQVWAWWRGSNGAPPWTLVEANAAGESLACSLRGAGVEGDAVHSATDDGGRVPHLH